MSTRGRAGTALVLASLACAAALVLLLRGGPDAATPDLARGPEPARAGSASADAGLERPAEDGAARGAAGPGPATSAARLARSDFDGRGTIRGDLVLARGVELRGPWTLVLEPNPYLEGRERAARRRVEMAASEREFRVDELPLGGYSVRAEVRGLNHVACSVLLVRGSPDQHVTLELRPAGFVDGEVRAADGGPAEALEVVLVAKPGGETRSVLTDAAGQYLFADVVDGEYAISFGSPDAPLIEPQELAFRAPSMRFPTRTLPPTGEIRLKTTAFGTRAPRAGAVVQGWTEPRGSFEVRTDAFGEARVRHLRPGRWRVAARGEDGSGTDFGIDVEAGEVETIEIPLVPR